MSIGHLGITPCVIDGKKLEFVNTFEYHGRLLSDNSNEMPTLCNRNDKGWVSFTKKESVLKNRHMLMVTKRKAYEIFVLTFTFTSCRNLKILL